MRDWRLAITCALLTVALGMVPTGAVDDPAFTTWPHGVLRALVLPTEPYVSVPLLALLIAWCLHRSRRRDALFTALAPAVAVAANTWLLKPVFDRWKGDTLVYPSGHTVSMVATLVVMLILFNGKARTVIAVAGAVLLTGVTIGMIGLGYHYLTDVIGGTFFAVATVLVIHNATRQAPAR